MSGTLDHHALALLFRPTDPAALKREAWRLARLGLTTRDIGAALRVEPAEVAGWLEEPNGRH